MWAGPGRGCCRRKVIHDVNDWCGEMTAVRHDHGSVHTRTASRVAAELAGGHVTYGQSRAACSRTPTPPTDFDFFNFVMDF